MGRSEYVALHTKFLDSLVELSLYEGDVQKDPLKQMRSELLSMHFPKEENKKFCDQPQSNWVGHGKMLVENAEEWQRLHGKIIPPLTP